MFGLLRNLGDLDESKPTCENVNANRPTLMTNTKSKRQMRNSEVPKQIDYKIVTRTFTEV